MKFSKCIVALTAISTSFFSLASQPLSVKCPDLSQVIEDYQSAIADKNEKKFVELFLTYAITWVGVNPDKKKGNLPSNEGLLYGAVPGFSNWLVNSDAKFEEKMTDIKINTDGNIANIFYNYEFILDDKIYGTGSANLSLINTTDCWKIASKIYSEHVPSHKII